MNVTHTNSLEIEQWSRVRFIDKEGQEQVGKLSKVEISFGMEVYYITVGAICHPVPRGMVVGEIPCYCDDVEDSFVNSHGSCKYCFYL